MPLYGASGRQAVRAECWVVVDGVLQVGHALLPLEHMADPLRVWRAETRHIAYLISEKLSPEQHADVPARPARLLAGGGQRSPTHRGKQCAPIGVVHPTAFFAE